ncbi:hypothetical protein ANO11243_084320 [Dothideomycetidae sp. 11243]|nr:hypothetical protein ANO11243_084320 [fungal sp. No.11243]
MAEEYDDEAERGRPRKRRGSSDAEDVQSVKRQHTDGSEPAPQSQDAVARPKIPEVLPSNVRRPLRSWSPLRANQYDPPYPDERAREILGLRFCHPRIDLHGKQHDPPKASKAHELFRAMRTAMTRSFLSRDRISPAELDEWDLGDEAFCDSVSAGVQSRVKNICDLARKCAFYGRDDAGWTIIAAKVLELALNTLDDDLRDTFEVIDTRDTDPDPLFLPYRSVWPTETLRIPSHNADLCFAFDAASPLVTAMHKFQHPLQYIITTSRTTSPFPAGVPLQLLIVCRSNTDPQPALATWQSADMGHAAALLGGTETRLSEEIVHLGWTV